MSLILEALKKSEQQRQREKAPNLQSIHQPAPIASKKSASPWWLLAVVVVILNLTFFVYWFWREQNNAAPLAHTTPTNTKPEPSTQTDSATPSGALTQNADTVQNSETAARSQPEFTQISPRGTVSQPVASEALQRVYEVNELPESVRNNLPAMTFSFHVYSENPEQRTIIINDRRIREGEDVSSGLRLEAITQDGVILFFEQHRIHISVLSDW